MIDLVSLAVNVFAELVTKLTSVISKNVPIIGNSALCAESLCTTSRTGINFYCLPNPLANFFFGTSCVFGAVGTTASGVSLVISFSGMPAAG